MNQGDRTPTVRASRRRQPLPRRAWGLTGALVFAAGLLLWAARGAIAPAFDRWLPPPHGTPHEPEPAVEAPPVEPEEPAAPAPTSGDLEAALAPLVPATVRLIAEGRGELTEFADLDSANELRARQLRSRWRPWGRIWHNRVAVLRRRTPAMEECRAHAALAPACDALHRSYTLLDQIPASGRVEDATELLDRAEAVLEELPR